MEVVEEEKSKEVSGAGEEEVRVWIPRECNCEKDIIHKDKKM